MRDWPTWKRAPVLALGLGWLGGGFEAWSLAATIRLDLGFLDAVKLGLLAVLAGGLVGFLAGLVAGPLAAALTRGRLPPARHALGMALSALFLAAWYLLPVARFKLQQGIPLAAGAFALTPVGVAGVIFFNAHYWLRREDIGEEYRLGWSGTAPLAALALVLLSAGWASGRGYGSSRALDTDPDVILVTIDTLRQDHVSAWHTGEPGDEAPVRTPVLDRLAAEGVRFADAITPLPETAPAHSAIMTGLHPARNGVLSNGHVLAPGYRTLAEVLAGEGYATGAFVSSVAVAARTGLDQGFQVYDDDLQPWVRGASRLLLARVGVAVIMRFLDPTDFPWLLERPAPVTFDHALAFLRRNPDRPVFLWVHLFEPHSPYEPHGLPGFEDNGTPGHPSVDHRWILSHEADFTYTDEVRRKLRRLYAEEVAYTDQQLGVFLDALDALGRDRPRDLVVAADHGEMLGEHGIEFNHHGIWDQTVRVPLIVVPHDANPWTRVVDRQVRLMDVPATILAMLGLERQEAWEGGDLMRFAEGVYDRGWASLLVGRKTASLSAGTLLGYRAPRADGKGDVKLVLDLDSGARALYDLASDPGETTDIAAEQSAVADELEKRVRAEVHGLIEQRGSTHLDRTTEAALEALGYIE